MNECWVDIIGYEGYYQVSSYGRVRSLDRIIKFKDGKRQRFFKGKVLKLGKTRGDYLFAHLQINKKCKNYRINRLVAIHFLKNPKNLPEVNHKDGNKNNNRSDNLEWCTPYENKKHAKENGLVPRVYRGEEHSSSKINCKIASEIRSIKKEKGMTNYEIGKIYSISATLVSNIINYKRWVHCDEKRNIRKG